MFEKFSCQSCCMRICIVMVKHESPYIHFLKNFWKALSGVLVNCNCLLCPQFDGLYQFCTFEENSLLCFFHFSLSFYHPDSCLSSREFWHLWNSVNHLNTVARDITLYPYTNCRRSRHSSWFSPTLKSWKTIVW